MRYAIGEIVLIVIGILIALQINNSNEQRKEIKSEKKILKELRSDYLYNKLELGRNIGKAQALVNRCDSLRILFNLPQNEVEVNKFSRLSSGLEGYSTFNPSNGALINLISSGDLKILRNDSLHTRLTKWSGLLEDVKEDLTVPPKTKNLKNEQR